jgi:hypothetical protein
MINAPVTHRVRRMILSGHSNKAIIEKLNVKPQVVYNIRYKLGKKKGLGALPVKVESPEPAPQAVKPTLWERVVAFFN